MQKSRSNPTGMYEMLIHVRRMNYSHCIVPLSQSKMETRIKQIKCIGVKHSYRFTLSGIVIFNRIIYSLDSKIKIAPSNNHCMTNFQFDTKKGNLYTTPHLKHDQQQRHVFFVSSETAIWGQTKV